MNYNILSSNFFLLSLLLLLFFGSGQSLGIGEVKQPPARRNLLSFPDDCDSVLLASSDGPTHMVYRDFGKIIWSFASGAPIPCSYLNYDDEKEYAFLSVGNFHIDCDDGSKLFSHAGPNIEPKDVSIKKFTINRPLISKGGVFLGFKKTTVFVVDANTCNIIRVHHNSTATSNPIVKKSITRDEYSFADILMTTGYFPSSIAGNSENSDNSDYLFWDNPEADNDVSFFCQENPNSVHCLYPSLHYDIRFISGDNDNFSLPLKRESKEAVHRLCSPRIWGSFKLFDVAAEHRIPLLLLPSNEHRLPDNKTQTVSSLVNNEQNPNISGPLDLSEPSYRVSVLADRRIVFFIISVVVVITIGVFMYRTLKDVKSEVVNETPTECDIEGGRSIGKLIVLNKVIAMGSNGTIIYQGKYDGRNVAVKRIVKEYKDVAIKETDNLTTSDSHTNVVRYFGREYDQDFIYLAMERCNCSLYDLIQIYLDAFKDDAADDTREARVIPDHKISLDLIKVLWYPNGNPSPILLKLLRDIVSGLVHLHELGIIHRDLKPNNVLILNQYKSLCVKLSDMGISRRLDENMSSLGDQATGCGSSGWKAPEQLGHGRQTKAMDMFSLGCVIFYCITCGRHPFGEPFERDDNITKGQFDLSSVEHIPEAVDLITQLLKPISKLSDRPKASEVLQHPLFWNAETRTSFLKEASDRVIMEYGASKSVILTSLETRASIVLRGEGWDKKVNGLLINHLVQHRHGKGYDYNKVEQLLRAIRNTLNHYKELPSPIQVVLGTSPDGVDDYFASRFPEFLMEVYKVMYSNCITEDWFRRYL